MRAASDEFMTQEEGATLGATLTAAPHSSIDRRMWYVGAEVPESGSPLIRRANMWDPGNRVSMIKVALSKEDAITNASVDLAVEKNSDSKRVPQKLFEFTVRLDAVLDISTAAKLAH